VCVCVCVCVCARARAPLNLCGKNAPSSDLGGSGRRYNEHKSVRVQPAWLPPLLPGHPFFVCPHVLKCWTWPLNVSAVPAVCLGDSIGLSCAFGQAFFHTERVWLHLNYERAQRGVAGQSLHKQALLSPCNAYTANANANANQKTFVFVCGKISFTCI